MKKRFFLIAAFVLGMGLAFTSCVDDEPEDVCSGEIGNIQDDFKCEKPVMPQICTIDGVDDHWILDGVEYACPENDCTVPPADMIADMQEKFDCSLKSLDMTQVNLNISKRARIVLANLKMQSTLCSD